MVNRNPSVKEDEEMVRMLNALNKDVKKAAQYSKEHNFESCERILKHVLSHIQTLQESFKDSEPGFSL